jgi:hypothetical protein
VYDGAAFKFGRMGKEEMDGLGDGSDGLGSRSDGRRAPQDTAAELSLRGEDSG